MISVMPATKPNEVENELYKANATIYVASEEHTEDSNNDIKAKEVKTRKERGETFLAALYINVMHQKLLQPDYSR
jgi:hypothetical protein